MKIVTKGAEAKLLEIVSNLRNAPDGYYALHYSLARLQEEFRSEYQIKIAVNVLGDLFKGLDSIAFVLKDGDVILLYNGTNRGLLEKAIFQLRYLFMDDPLAYTDDGYENEDFCAVFDLEFQWRDFYVACKRKVGREITEEVVALEPPTSRIETPTGNRSKLHMFTPAYLVQVVSELKSLDVSSALRSQPVCALVKDKDPKVLFKEVYTNIQQLQQLLSVNVDLMSSRTLFKYLTKTLDKRVLFALKDQAAMKATPISINLNVKTLMSDDFSEFDASINPKLKSSIIIEINIADVFEDIQTFMMAKAELQELGYRICLDGLDDMSFMQIDRKSLGFDLVKLKWNSEMGNKVSKHKALEDAIKACGTNRVILCRCDNEAALDYGRTLGLSLFQGRQVDRILNPEAEVVN